MLHSDTSPGKIWYLKKVNFFKGMTQEDMTALAHVTEMKNIRKKDVIFLPGQPGNHVYLLKKGYVKISRILPDGRELTMALLQPGEIFGELEAVEESPRNTQALAHTDALICVLSKSDLMNLIQKKPELGIRLTKLIGFRRRVIENRLENLIYRNVPERLAALLVELSQQFGEKADEDIRINIALTHEDLANLIGTARATVTETLGEFKDQGLIASQGKLITIKRLDRLTSIWRAH